MKFWIVFVSIRGTSAGVINMSVKGLCCIFERVCHAIFVASPVPLGVSWKASIIWQFILMWLRASLR